MVQVACAPIPLVEVMNQNDANVNVMFMDKVMWLVPCIPMHVKCLIFHYFKDICAKMLLALPKLPQNATFQVILVCIPTMLVGEQQIASGECVSG